MDKPDSLSRAGNPDSAAGPRKAEDALRRSEERFRMLVESSPNALVIVDRKGAITLLNRQGEWLFGYRREELIHHLQG